jgi:acyl-coenzyme A synthetase/AMP-(fatty) acid ligase
VPRLPVEMSNVEMHPVSLLERWGEAPHAFVVLRQGAQTNEAELREFARANLAHFKAPHSVTFVKELPKTATGKIQKYILRDRSTAIAPQ